MQAYGRKYDHVMVLMKFKLRLKNQPEGKRKDFKALKNAEVSEAHELSLRKHLPNLKLQPALMKSGRN